MTTNISQATDPNVEPELERLTYSAYLLTLDPALALSVVMAAIDSLLEEPGADTNLEARTVELSLQHLQARSSAPLRDGDPRMVDASLLTAWRQDLVENPILSLDALARIAFVLHHVLGYSIQRSAAFANLSAKEFRAQLRSAYLQLDSQQFVHGMPSNAVLAECARA